MNNVFRSRMLNGSVYSLKQMCCEAHRAVLLMSFYRKIKMNQSSKIKVKVVNDDTDKFVKFGRGGKLLFKGAQLIEKFLQSHHFGLLESFSGS